MSEVSGRNYWPVVLVAIPFAAVLFGIFMVTTIIYFPDDLVADNYYKDGMAINERLAEDELAEKMNLTATLVSIHTDKIEISINSVVDSAIALNLYHVTDSDRDFSLIMVPEEGQLYSAEGSDLQVLSDKGVWYIELEGTDQAWRLRERIQTPLKGLEIHANG